ncbi:MAG: signal peptidase I [Dehalococcoidales bacterium]
MRAFIREILVIIVLAIVIFVGLQFVVQDYIIREYCMEPCFQEGQRILVSKIIYRFHEPERGDVIVFQPPPPYSSEASPFIKRIIALPGDTVEIKEGSVYINGSQLDEPYIKEPPKYTFRQLKIPDDNYFVLGDNRNNANDSHTGWTVPRQNIIGKAWLKIWPPGEWGLVTHYPLHEQLASSSI